MPALVASVLVMLSGSGRSSGLSRRRARPGMLERCCPDGVSETSNRRRSAVLTVRVMSPSRSMRSSSRVMPLRLSASATTMEAVSSCRGSVPDGAQAIGAFAIPP